MQTTGIHNNYYPASILWVRVIKRTYKVDTVKLCLLPFLVYWSIHYRMDVCGPTECTSAGLIKSRPNQLTMHATDLTTKHRHLEASASYNKTRMSLIKGRQAVQSRELWHQMLVSAQQHRAAAGLHCPSQSVMYTSHLPPMQAPTMSAMYGRAYCNPQQEGHYCPCRKQAKRPGTRHLDK